MSLFEDTDSAMRPEYGLVDRFKVSESTSMINVELSIVVSPNNERIRRRNMMTRAMCFPVTIVWQTI